LIVAAGILGLVGATALGLGKDEGERLIFVALTTGFSLVTASIEMTIFHYQAQLSFVRAGVIEVVRSTVILLLACGAAVGILETGAAVALAFDVGVGILALFVASESVFLTIFVLISQNRMARQAERRSHLDLQVGMLAEQELTTMLQMLQRLCQHAGVDVKSATQQVQGFSETTDVHKLASELEDKLPEQ